MRKMRFFAAALCMILCLAAIPQESFAAPVNQQTAGNIGRVQGVKVGVCTSKSINVHWQMIPGAHGYEIYRSIAKDGKYTLLKSVPPATQAFMNTTVVAGKEYFYKIRAFVNVGTKRSYGKFSKVLRANTKPLAAINAKTKFNVNVRKYAGTNYPVIVGLVKGTRVKVLCETCDKTGARWYRIQVKVNGKKYKGYIRGDLLG